jgi:hypothetical protein
MKKITLALSGIFLVSSAFGQRIGIHAAVISTSQSISASGLNFNSDGRVS